MIGAVAVRWRAVSRPSRTGKDDQRRATAIAESSPVAWSTVRDLYPPNIADAVDDLVGRGGVSLRDLSALTLPQLLRDLEDQQDGAELRAEVSRHLRLLFRISVVSGGMGDGSTVLVQVPEGLGLLPDPDDGDELL